MIHRYGKAFTHKTISLPMNAIEAFDTAAYNQQADALLIRNPNRQTYNNDSTGEYIVIHLLLDRQRRQSQFTFIDPP